MFKRSFFIIAVFTLSLVISCAISVPKPGTGGKKSSRKIDETDHLAVPDGVSCYVCHKEDIPEYEFHTGYGKKCEECHDLNSWIAKKYLHPAWTLDKIHRTRCTRCHTKAIDHNFTFYQCYGCHHEEKAIQNLHANRNLKEITNCIACHERAPGE